MRTTFHSYTFRALLALFCGTALFAGSAVQASAALAPEVQAKVDGYLKKLQDWAADPAIVSAVKAANAKGGIAGMNNAKWVDLADTAPEVQAILETSASGKVHKWGADSGINKLYVRDAKGNLVAGNNKPLIYNVAARPPFKVAITGTTFHATAVKPDPTTQLKSVQIAVPVKDGGSVIGVMHAAVTVE